MASHESFESYRIGFQPKIPHSLRTISALHCVNERRVTVEEEIRVLLSHLDNDWVVGCIPQASTAKRRPLRVGVVLSGGPAPGGHTVIAGLFDAIQEWNPKSTVIGFLEGPQGLLKNNARELTREEIDRIRNTGGFSLLGTGRQKIESTEEIARAVVAVQHHTLDGLVCIGGDDSNTDAAFLAEAFRAFGLSTCVIGVPKTIDGDLQSPEIPISFGFDTACKVYSSTIGNIAHDILSTKKQYFFIRLMGRAASHITLECALRTQPNLALISEEVAAREMTLPDLVREVADLVEERYSTGRMYGLVLVPEGVIEQMVDVKQLIAELNDLFAPSHPLSSALTQCPTLAERLRYVVDTITEPSRLCLSVFPQDIKEQLVHERDPHGNVQVSQIETARLLAVLVQTELYSRAAHTGTRTPFSFQTAFCGYEGRSAFPSTFDCTYCYALGRLSAVLIAKNMTGYMTGITGLHLPPLEWMPHAVPFASLLHFERRGGVRKPVVKKTFVDLSGELFHHFADRRAAWRCNDEYLQPGPMQFFGPCRIVEEPCLSVTCRG
jgi:pyrophosphate--fructose-6-phosphate 1-phosphotransferase